ncbi:MAG: hypothetical protein BJ554DRAFT_421 [Olpidium bornovanus]|uniref:Uncharacterized protein n=1 Tax=Olpidium bornovanus TaxID=278681 RepID=A0A8H7ZTT1_9FUNG|nr:MAG: hypothetical protein BJ554DRAFT_421 [Olpidium bornovanus]
MAARSCGGLAGFLSQRAAQEPLDRSRSPWRCRHLPSRRGAHVRKRRPSRRATYGTRRSQRRSGRAQGVPSAHTQAGPLVLRPWQQRGRRPCRCAASRALRILPREDRENPLPELGEAAGKPCDSILGQRIILHHVQQLVWPDRRHRGRNIWFGHPSLMFTISFPWPTFGTVRPAIARDLSGSKHQYFRVYSTSGFSFSGEVRAPFNEVIEVGGRRS